MRIVSSWRQDEEFTLGGTRIAKERKLYLVFQVLARQHDEELQLQGTQIGELCLRWHDD